MGNQSHFANSRSGEGRACERSTGFGIALRLCGWHSAKIDKALYWVTKSADQNLPAAEYTLGMMYKSGAGVTTNQAMADTWFQKAADQGHVPSEHEAALATDRKGKRTEALLLRRG